MRIAFAWAVTVSGIVACGMFLGGLSRGGMRVPMMMLGILGVGVAVTGGRAVAKERRRSVRGSAASDTRRRRRAGKLRSVIFVALLFAAAVAGALLVRKYL